ALALAGCRGGRGGGRVRGRGVVLPAVRAARPRAAGAARALRSGRDRAVVIAFVRHGQTASNRGGQLQGRFDAPLTAEGDAQAARVAAALQREAPARLVTSPL